ncbi:NAD-dependent epimerase/dehydratase family protein [Actinomadura geliboluensis]|uniref:NAD-dependent epimerase/dehydratase family protein n=1 Tax=Actinomadura geliboluensis TaxID=882440 RepID=UPI0036A8A4EC
MSPGPPPASPAHWKGRRVLVTGGGGFLGTWFARRLAEIGAEVVAVHRPRPEGPLPEGLGDGWALAEADLRSPAEVESLLRGPAAGTDTVVHCAAVYGDSAFKRRHGGTLLAANSRLVSTVLDAARRHGAGTLVLISSTEVYSAALTGPIREEDDHRARPDLSGDGYALAKVFAELLADEYRREFGMTVFTARPANVYGPGDGLGPRPPLAVPAMLRRLAAGEPVPVWGGGRQRRSFVHVEDMVEAVLQMVASGAFDTFNVAAPGTVSMLELAHMVAAEFGAPDRVELRPDLPGGPPVREFDTARMRRVIDFEPRPLRTGIADTVRWFREGGGGPR